MHGLSTYIHSESFNFPIKKVSFHFVKIRLFDAKRDKIYIIENIVANIFKNNYTYYYILDSPLFFTLQKDAYYM